MLINDVVFVGIGQGGGNIVKELELLDAKSFYINTSIEDLDTINADYSNRYHIEGKNGMGKDLDYSKEIISDENVIDDINRKLYNRYANAKLFVFVYTLGGGTGGGMGTTIANSFGEYISGEGKISNVIGVRADDSEDIGILGNSIRSLQELIDVFEDKEGNGSYINNIQILDNNTREKLSEVNKDFAITISRLLTYDHITTQGNFDENEVFSVVTARGFTTMVEFSNENFEEGLKEAINKTVYVKPNKNPSLHGWVLCNKHDTKTNRELIKEVFGVPAYTHHSTWEDETNIIVSSGSTFNYDILNEMKLAFNCLVEKKREIEQKSLRSTKDETIDVDFSILNKSKSTNAKDNTKPAARSRANNNASRRRKTASIIDKYRNIGK